jgi:CubicO group peptidase (beta-lactamase class C family)
MEQDAFFTVDSIGTPFAGGGLNSSLRDLARIGQLILDNGRVGNEQIFPKEVVDRIREGGGKKEFDAAGYQILKGWSYRSMWWNSHNEHGAFMARGVHGQSLYIDPEAEMVIVRFASNPIAGNAANDPVTLPSYHALAGYLKKLP